MSRGQRHRLSVPRSGQLASTTPYLHGPLLPKNPYIADVMIRNALIRRTGDDGIQLDELDDKLEADTRRELQRRFL